MIHVGEELKSTREASGISLDEVSRDLNIPVLILEQIEDGSMGSFNDIYELKQMIMDYAKYLGLNVDNVVNQFNEYMFDYTDKIPMSEIEKAIEQKNKEEEMEDRVISPYTRIVPASKKLPYILTGIGIIILIIIVLFWSVRQVKINRSGRSLAYDFGGYYEFTK